MTPPDTIRSEPVQQAIKNLGYGMISVNEWVALAIMTSGGVWGCHGLDHTRQSGRGFVGNPYRLPCVEKMVMYRDLRLKPAFDELTQPPPLFINKLGFELACRPSSNIMLLFNLFCVCISFLFNFFESKVLVYMLDTFKVYTRSKYHSQPSTHYSEKKL